MTWIYFLTIGIALAIMVIFFLASRREEAKADENVAEIRKLERLQEGLLKGEVDADLLPTLMSVMSESATRLAVFDERFKQEKLTQEEIEEYTKLRTSLKTMQIAASKHVIS